MGSHYLSEMGCHYTISSGSNLTKVSILFISTSLDQSWNREPPFWIEMDPAIQTTQPEIQPKFQSPLYLHLEPECTRKNRTLKTQPKEFKARGTLQWHKEFKSRGIQSQRNSPMTQRIQSQRNTPMLRVDFNFYIILSAYL